MTHQRGPKETTMTTAIGNGWTEIVNTAALERALTAARGRYQRNLLLGYESLSGSTLRGKAKSYSGRYANSRDALLNRVRVVGVIVSERRADHNRRILLLS